MCLVVYEQWAVAMLVIVPYGKAGKSFVSELARLFKSFAEGSALESVALKACTLMPILLLQKPARKSKPKDHILCLERRLCSWKDGDFEELLREGRTIQQHISKVSPPYKDEQVSRSFANLMFQGKTSSALRLLTEQNKGVVLHLNDSVDTSNGPQKVKEILISKHPPGHPVSSEAIVSGVPPDIYPVRFESLDATVIKNAVLKTSGAAGPSGLDALGWRRLCTSFKSASQDLCHSLALTAKRICTNLIDPACIAPLLACRLIALNKNPGVRPIGVGEIPRRVIAKAILFIVRQDIQEAAGSIQLCAGQIAGVEAAVHAVHSLFHNEETEAVLLVDASNAFNCLNRLTALHNIQRVCPSLSTALINTYRDSSELYVDGDVLLSQEGTTQGDPLAMPMFALATIPLIENLQNTVSDVHQVWYADDASGSGKLSHLRVWWDQLNFLGPKFGYYPNAAKTWLVVKNNFSASAAAAAFANTGVKITSEGRPYLGVPIGTDDFVESFVSTKVQEWVAQLEKLALIACSQPHAAYAAFTHGLISKGTRYLFILVGR